MKKRLNQYSVALSGLIAGVSEVCMNHPLWVVKTRMQTGELNPWRLRGIYFGLTSSVTSMVPLIGLRLVASDFFSGKLSKTKINKNSQLILSGAIGSIAVSLISSPMELIRTKQMIFQASFISTVKHLLKMKGGAVLMSGILSTSVRDAVYTTGYVGLYPLAYNRLNKPRVDNLYIKSLSKVSSGIFSAVVSQPFDAIRIEQQVSCEEKSKSIVNAMRNIYRRQGLYGFFVGSSPRLARVTSGVCIISTAYEKSMEFFAHL